MQTEAANPLEGRRILVVEDEMILALAVEELLGTHGVEVLGPLSSVSRVLDFLGSERPDCVTLDMNLKGDFSLPIAETLNRLDIPFVIVSGYIQSHAEDPQLRNAPFLRKPFADEELIAALHSVLI